MESLSPSQIRDINSLYSKMYEPEWELVERYLSEDEIRLNYAYALSESKNDYSDEQLSAVVEIMTEMTLNMQRGEQAISKILGEEIALSETVGVLEEKEELQEFDKVVDAEKRNIPKVTLLVLLSPNSSLCSSTLFLRASFTFAETCFSSTSIAM